jgi:hypothetical protein
VNERHPVSSVAGFDFFTATARPSRMGRIVANSFCGAVNSPYCERSCSSSACRAGAAWCTEIPGWGVGMRKLTALAKLNLVRKVLPRLGNGF